jgi:hypothetical protein
MDFYQIKMTVENNHPVGENDVRTLYVNVPDNLPAEAVEFDGTIRLEVFNCDDLIACHYPTLIQIKVHHAIIVTDIKSNFLADKQATVDANPPKAFKPPQRIKVIKLVSD